MMYPKTNKKIPKHQQQNKKQKQNQNQNQNANNLISKNKNLPLVYSTDC